VPLVLLTIIDLAVLVFVAVAGVRMAYLGVHAHKKEFVVWGALLAFFAVWQGVRQETTQQSWTKILNGVSSDVKILKDKPPVQVFVPPAQSPPRSAKQRAIMEIPDNGIKFDHNSQYGWWVNIECRNAGASVTAKNVACEAFVAEARTEQGAPTRKSLQEIWDEFSKMSFHPALVDLEPGKGIWGSFGYGHMMEIDPALTAGEKVIVVVGAIPYRDDAGKHAKEYCRWSQPPFDPTKIMWHFCEIGHNGEAD
jgi:hypothetical protein